MDIDDRVVGQITRAEMRRTGARHRATYVVVRTSDGGVVVHRRADWKDICPGFWDLCFGGVVDAGEDWDAAAARELAEEAGIAGDLRHLGTGRFDAPGVGINCEVYDVTHDGPYPCPDGEVVETRVVPLDALASFVADHDVCPDSVDVVLPHLVGELR
ncbi:MAG: NUDIX domain-containing protein [Acidimicrobiales bacterium]|nr:NUDIX domain-containing protein [Acidimicrobiales bacterium]